MKRKQMEVNQTFLDIFENPGDYHSRREILSLVDQTALEVERLIAERRWTNMAYAWSGGKDSQALEMIMDKVGIKQSFIIVASALEYPAFNRWLPENSPPDLIIMETGLDLEWLAKHESWLFPTTHSMSAKWFKIIQWDNERRYYRDHQLDALFLGRRLDDGNQCGAGGISVGRDSRVYVNPIYNWTHAQVVCLMRYFYNPCPLYHYPDGFIVGTGIWPKRKSHKSRMEVWDVLYSIDPSIVYSAEPYLQSARDYLQRRK